jgi:UTP--glucose-1-phosphate uridylyltransferase
MITKCLFPAAGYGTRFLPATKAMPKEMLPILSKPLIQYGVEEALSAGIRVMGIVTGRGKRAIEDHFDISYELEHQIKGTDKEHYLTDIRAVIDKCKFVYARQREMRGLGDAILVGEPIMGDEPFAVLLADDLCHNQNSSVLSQMRKLFDIHKCTIIAIEEIDIKDSGKYGIVSGEDIGDGVIDIKELIEKPDPKDAKSNLAIIGRYILMPTIFDEIRETKAGKNGEVQITDALNAEASKSRVLGLKFKGKRFDCGSIDGFVEATNFFYNKEK